MVLLGWVGSRCVTHQHLRKPSPEDHSLPPPGWAEGDGHLHHKPHQPLLSFPFLPADLPSFVTFKARGLLPGAAQSLRKRASEARSRAETERARLHPPDTEASDNQKLRPWICMCTKDYLTWLGKWPSPRSNTSPAPESDGTQGRIMIAFPSECR